MVVDCKFTLEQIKDIAKSMVILVDTREKQNQHIIDYFIKHNIDYRKQALSYGDYSFYIPENQENNIKQDMYFHRAVVVERKASLEELSGNLGKERERFEKELLKACKDNCKTYLLVENPRGYNDIMEHNYRTEFKPLQFVTSLKSFENKYNINLQFVEKQYAGYMIYSSFYYFMREHMS